MMFSDDNDSENISFKELYAMYEGYESKTTVNNILLIIIYIPVFLVAIIGNLIVLVVILTDPRMRRSSANCFLVNLAITDFMVAIVCIPMTSINYVYSVWVLGTTVCKVTSYMQGVCIVNSVLTIVLMSIDRYLAIRHPMKNKQIFTVNRIRRLIIFTWITAGVMVIPIALVNQVVVAPEFRVNNYYCTEIWPTHELRQVYVVAFLVCVYIWPGCATVVLYTLMGCRLWAKDAHLQRQNSIHKRDEILIARRRLALMMIIISILFAVSWLPYYTFNIFFDFELDASGQLIHIYPFTILLGHSNCAQNPILYCFMHKTFRSCVLKALRCKCRRGPLTGAGHQYSYGSDLQERGSTRSWNKKSERNRILLKDGCKNIITCTSKSLINNSSSQIECV